MTDSLELSFLAKVFVLKNSLPGRIVEKACQAGLDLYGKSMTKHFDAELCCRFCFTRAGEAWSDWKMTKAKNQQIVPIFTIWFAKKSEQDGLHKDTTGGAKKRLLAGEAAQSLEISGCKVSMRALAAARVTRQDADGQKVCCLCLNGCLVAFPQVFHGTVQSMEAAPKLQTSQGPFPTPTSFDHLHPSPSISEVLTSSSNLWWNSSAATVRQSFSQFFRHFSICLTYPLIGTKRPCNYKIIKTSTISVRTSQISVSVKVTRSASIECQEMKRQSGKVGSERWIGEIWYMDKW